MGKAIILVFFAIGFVIFLVLKYAVFGVKAAYKAVNDPDGFEQEFSDTPRISSDDEKAAHAVGIIESMLGVQTHLMGYELGSVGMHSKASNDFSIGYIFGFCDGFVQASTLPTDEKTFTFLSLNIFMRVFGPKHGADLFARATDLQTSDNEAYLEGRMTGGKEALAFVTKGSNSPPMGWSTYVHDLGPS